MCRLQNWACMHEFLITSRTSLLLPRSSTVALLPGFSMPVTFTTFPFPTCILQQSVLSTTFCCSPAYLGIFEQLHRKAACDKPSLLFPCLLCNTGVLLHILAGFFSAFCLGPTCAGRCLQSHKDVTQEVESMRNLPTPPPPAWHGVRDLLKYQCMRKSALLSCRVHATMHAACRKVSYATKVWQGLGFGITLHP